MNQIIYSAIYTKCKSLVGVNQLQSFSDAQQEAADHQWAAGTPDAWYNVTSLGRSRSTWQLIHARYRETRL